MKTFNQIKDAIFTILAIFVSIPVLFALWSIVTFITLISQRLWNPVIKFSAFTSLVMMGAIPRVKGKLPDLSNTGSYVIVGNHSSFIDYFLLIFISIVILGEKAFTGVFDKKSIKKLPVFSFIVQKYGLGVDRGSKKSILNLVREMKKKIEAGVSVSMFPENTRISKSEIEENNRLLPFKDGAFVIAKNNNIPVIPVAFCLPFNFRSKEKYVPLHPQFIDIYVGDVISTEDKTIEEIKEQAYKAIEGKVNQYEYKI